MVTKFPFIRHRPTVLDEFPLDVIRVFIVPYLDYESRINFNQCLPRWDRLSKKMDPVAVKTHERMLRVDTLKYIQYALRDIEYPFSQEGQNERIKLLTKYFHYHLNPLYFSIIEDNENYRNMTLSKIQEFTQSLITYRGDTCINRRLKLVKVMAKLRKKIENSGPYGPTIKYRRDLYRLEFF